MYSTPGISQSSFSMGLVTRSSTSCAEAPGICTNTSIMGTMICGSSSRGSFHTAKAPMSRAAQINRGVSLEEIHAWAKRPAGPRWRGSLIGGPRPGRHPASPAGTGSTTFSPAFRPDRTSTAPPVRRPVVTSRVCATPSSTTNTDCNWPRSVGRPAGRPPPFAMPSGKMARPNMPVRNCGAAGRSSFTT